ncbi:MAG TPA: N-acetylmuramoyl-L-alanine amidase [bacterium]|nr:N-acetylmuramoyl-L-alanine amidase [bacterium]
MRNILISTAFLLILFSAGVAKASGAEESYLRAKSCYGHIRITPAKAKRHSEWQRCIALFENVQKKYPTSERAPQALFNIGKLSVEAWGKFKKRGDAEAAIRAYNQLVREYPKSSLADDSLFEIGKLRIDPMGQKERARVAFTYIVDNYPHGDMAPKAKAALEAMDGGVALPSEEPVMEKPRAAKPKALEHEVVGAPTPAAKAPPASAKPAPKPPTAAAAGRKKAAPAAGPKNIATLNAIEISNDDAETAVTLKLSHRAAYSVEFTEMGVRTKSPPRLQILLMYTKQGPNLSRDISVNSPHLQRIKIKRGLLDGGTHVLLDLSPDASYSISSAGDRITVLLKRGSARNSPRSEVRTTRRSWFGKKKKPFVVVIDPGHGGADPGAVGPKGAREKDVTLALSKRLAAAIRSSVDAKVYLTRRDDRTLSLEDRNAFAVAKKADLFISIHANASTDRRSSGIETYYLNNATDEAAARLAKRENRGARKKISDVERILSIMLQNYDAAESRLLASDVQGSLAKNMRRRYSGVKNRSVRSALFYVLVGAKCPAILVETSFISNPVEEKRLLRRDYQSDIASSIAAGVREYLKANDKRLVSL